MQGKTENLNIRVSSDDLALFKRAAEAKGQSLSAFVLEAALGRARAAQTPDDAAQVEAVKRYDVGTMYLSGQPAQGTMLITSDGDYVLYSDYETLARQLAEARVEAENANNLATDLSLDLLSKKSIIAATILRAEAAEAKLATIAMPVAVGWAYRDKRWDKNRWHLCGSDSKPRPFENREIAEVCVFSDAAALSKRDAPQAQVKALEWRDRHMQNNRYGDLVASNVLGQYVIRPAKGMFRLWLPGSYFNDERRYEDLEAAKSAAQADFERRILSALTRPSTTEAKPVEAKLLSALSGEIAYALTKRLVIDMPTARAAVDEAIEVIENEELPPNWAACCNTSRLDGCDCVNKQHIRVLFALDNDKEQRNG